MKKLFLCAAILAIGLLAAANASAAEVLGVTQITAVQTYAENDNTFEHGWKWVFDVTVPTSETVLKMRFADWVGVLGGIPAANNIRYYSAQSTNAFNQEHALLIPGADIYSARMNLNSEADLNSDKAGMQIEITVEARIPQNSPGGSYSTSYGIHTWAPQTITFNPIENKTYGDSTFALSATASSGLPVSFSVVSGPVTLSDGNKLTITGAGSVTVKASQAGSGNFYPAPDVTQTFDVVKATPTITWVDPASIVYGTALSETQLNATSPVAGTFAYAPIGGTVLNAGANQTLSTTFTPTDSANYTSATKDVQITVTQDKPVITWDNPADIVYGTALGETQLNAKASVEGSFAYSPAMGTVLAAGAHTLSVTFTPADATNYISATATVAINVNPAPVTITAYSGSMVYGGTVPTITPVYSPEVTTTAKPTCSTAATSTSSVGAYASTCTGADDSNYTFSYIPGSVLVTPATSVVSITCPASQIYTGSAITPCTATVTGANSLNQSVPVTYSDNVVVGTATVSATYIGDANHTGSSATASFSITPATVTVTASSDTMVYGGPVPPISATYSPAITPATALATCLTAATATSNVGKYDSTCSGASDPNYSFQYVNGTVTVTPAAASVTLGELIQTYDGNGKSVTVTTNPSGISTSVTYNGKPELPTNAGSYTVVATITNPNYSGSASETLIINQARATVTATGNSKTYDGTPAATVSLAVTGAVNGDVLAAKYDAASFDNKNVGIGKTVTVTGITLTGDKAGNYTFNTTATSTANITPASLTVTATGGSKVYDGNTSAHQVALSTNAFMTDAVTPTGVSYFFIDKNVGSAKPVKVEGISISGLDSANYFLVNTSADTTATITAKELTISGITANNKPYDGTTTATLTGTAVLAGVVPTDVVVLGGAPSATFNTPDVGEGKPVTVTGYEISGVDYKNYSLTQPIGLTANITPSEKLPGKLAAEDFGVMNFSNVLGYSAGFGLTEATIKDAKSVEVKLYSGTTLLQTNTGTSKLAGETWTSFSSPFDIKGTFNYGADGYWTNVRESEYGQTLVPTKVVATVVLANWKTVTAENTNLTGDTTIVLPVSVITINSLQPDWGTGVFSAYIGPTGGYVSPGVTELYDGREAGVIKAGITVGTDGHYSDEGLFAIKPTLTINQFALRPLSYDVVNQYGENPVWMTIEIDTGTKDYRDDNTVYQFVPTTNPASWHTVNPAAGLWQKWNNGDGDTTGSPLVALSDIVSANDGLNVVRAYLRLGMGDSYHGTAGQGTIAWVDKVSLDGKTYDFVLRPYVPMSVSYSAPEFTVGQEAPFTVSTVANDDAGKMVKAHFTIPQGVNATYEEGGNYYPLVDVYGPSAGFPVISGTSHFKAVISQAGTYTVKVEFKTLDNIIVASKDILVSAVNPPIIPDTTRPVVISFTPSDNSVGVPVAVQPKLTFSEPLKLSTVTSSSIELREFAELANDSHPIASTRVLSEGNTVVTIQPDAPLTYGKQYYFFIGTGVEDLAGNAFASETWYHSQRTGHEFTTELQ